KPVLQQGRGPVPVGVLFSNLLVTLAIHTIITRENWARSHRRARTEPRTANCSDPPAVTLDKQATELRRSSAPASPRSPRGRRPARQGTRGLPLIPGTRLPGAS